MQRRKYFSIIVYLLLGFSVILSFLNPQLINAESQIIKLEKIKDASADASNFKFILTADKARYDKSEIEIIDDIIIEDVENLPEGIQYDKETQTIQIDWSTLPEENEVEIPAKLSNKDSEEIEVLTVDNDNKEIKETMLLPSNKSNSDSSSLDKNQSSGDEDSGEEVSSNSSNVETSHTSDTSDTSSEESSAKEANTSSSHSDNIDDSEVSIVEKKRVENAGSSESKESDDIKSSSNFSISSSNHSSNSEMSISTTNKVDSKITGKQSARMKVAQTQGTTVTVSRWNDFVDAMKNASVAEINIVGDIHGPQTFIGHKEEVVNGNKVIYGNQHILDFADNNFDIQDNQVSLDNGVIEADQDNNTDASLFFSNIGGKLTINNVSFNGKQEGQVARLPRGKITVQGTNVFFTDGPFEIFEANHIIFESNSTFDADNMATGLFDSSLKELINLYGDSIIDIENNAEVKLQIKDRKSVINSLPNQNSQINIKENASLNVIGKYVSTNDGHPLINLPGQGSSINIGKNAELNIENSRSSSNVPGHLISMNGSINMHPSGSKVEYWQMGINYNQYTGQNYVKFPSILDGKINFNGGTIGSASMSPQSSLSISENSSRNNKTFSELLSNVNTNNIGRLRITKAEAPNQPEVERLTDLDVKLKGKATPGLTIHISDEFGNSWEPVADSDTGEFSVDLGDFAPYDLGDKFTVTAADAYGNTSNPLTVTVVGNRLSFRVPTRMDFEQTIIRDEFLTIPRVDKDWEIEVTNTRQNSNPWRVTAQAQSPLTTADGQDSLENALVFIKDNNNQSLNNEVLVYEEDLEDDAETTINWQDNQGVLLQLNPQEEQVQTYKTYKTTIDWTLTDAP